MKEGIELTRLTDDDGSGADEEHFVQIGASRHVRDAHSWSCVPGTRLFFILWQTRLHPRGGAIA